MDSLNKANIILGLIFACILFYILHSAKIIFMPIAIAFLLHFLLSPLVNFMKKIFIPRYLGSAIVVILFVGIILYGFFGLAKVAIDWAIKAQENTALVTKKLSSSIYFIRRPIDAFSNLNTEIYKLTQESKIKQKEVVDTRKSDYILNLFSHTWDFVIEITITAILLLFLLASGDLYLRKILFLFTRLNQKKEIVKTAYKIQKNVWVYLAAKTIINSVLAIVISLLMYVLKMPYPILWGVLAGILEYVPNIGIIVGTIIISFASILNYDNLTFMLLVPAVFFLVSSFSGSIITPIVLGRQLMLNSIVVFFCVIFWGFVWGIPGALIGVPLTAAFKILCDHVPSLQSVGEFLGE